MQTFFPHFLAGFTRGTSRPFEREPAKPGRVATLFPSPLKSHVRDNVVAELRASAFAEATAAISLAG
jgi:hypothetical protein